MAYWLLKSEPDAWSWQQQVRKGARGEAWTGVRNHQAKLNLMRMKTGDRAFFYHSNIGKEIVGIMRVVKLAHPDSTAEPNDKGKVVWECVDVVAHTRLPKPVTLEVIKHTPGLENMALVKLSRLSAMPIPPKAFAKILGMGKTKP